MTYPRILITGVGKSGSTALFYSILKNLPENAVRLFEPENSKKTLPDDTAPPALVKSFIPYSENFSFFEKKILLVRDPRDNLISLLLYKPYNIIGKFFPGEKEKAVSLVNDFIGQVEKKEKGQPGISVRSLAEKLDISAENRMEKVSDYFDRHPDCFVLKYEDYIDGKLGPLGDYLNLDIAAGAEIPEKFDRVARTRNYGNWRSWFTPDDVAFYRPLMHSYMEKFGYGDDWALDPDSNPDPGTGSRYIRKIITEAEAIRASRKLDLPGQGH